MLAGLPQVRGVKIFEEGDGGVSLRGRDLRLCCCASRSVILGAIFPPKELHTIYTLVCYMQSSYIVYCNIVVYIALSIRSPTLLPNATAFRPKKCESNARSRENTVRRGEKDPRSDSR